MPANPRTPLDSVARRTGLAWLGIVATGLFAEFFVRSTLVVPGDAVATAANVAARPRLFGAGIAADLVMVALDVTVAFGLYRLLRPVDRGLALAATGFRLLQAAILAVNLSSLVRALGFAREAAAGASTATDALRAIETHALVYDVALVPFGLACVVVGHLLRRHRLVPIPYAWGLLATGAVYLVGSSAAVFAPALQATIDPLYGIAIVAEPAFALWLIVRGLRPVSSADYEVPTTTPSSVTTTSSRRSWASSGTSGSSWQANATSTAGTAA